MSLWWCHEGELRKKEIGDFGPMKKVSVRWRTRTPIIELHKESVGNELMMKNGDFELLKKENRDEEPMNENDDDELAAECVMASCWGAVMIIDHRWWKLLSCWRRRVPTNKSSDEVLLKKESDENEPMKGRAKEKCNLRWVVMKNSGNNEPMKECGGNELLKKESGDDRRWMRTAVIELLKERVDDDLMTKSSDDELLKKSYKLMTSCRGTVVMMSWCCEGDLLDMGCCEGDLLDMGRGDNEPMKVEL